MERKINVLLIAMMATVFMSCQNPVTDPPATDTGPYTSVTIGSLQYVPAGTFQRDATATNTSTVGAFRISEKEITRAQFLLVMAFDPSDTSISPDQNCPVQNVTFYNAIVFCNKLSILDGLTPVYKILESTNPSDWGVIPSSSNPDWNSVIADWSADGYRLPTEMEWMWAAMGADKSNPGIINTSGYLKLFSGSNGSNLIADYVLYFRNSGDLYLDGTWNGAAIMANNPKALAVGSKTANELGIFDMSGNVLEFCWDLNGDYPLGSVSDYRGPVSGAERILRGGSWFAQEEKCSVSYRHKALPEFFWKNHGLRVARN